MKGFLDGVNAASLGLMLAVCVTLGGSTLHNVNAWIIFAIAALALLRWSVNPAWVVGGAAIAGWLLSRFAI
jgi:chromate transporter